MWRFVPPFWWRKHVVETVWAWVKKSFCSLYFLKTFATDLSIFAKYLTYKSIHLIGCQPDPWSEEFTKYLFSFKEVPWKKIYFTKILASKSIPEQIEKFKLLFRSVPTCVDFCHPDFSWKNKQCSLKQNYLCAFGWDRQRGIRGRITIMC